MPSVSGLDHLVLTVKDVARSVAFYRQVLGMGAAPFTPADGSTRWALTFGAQKINLHAAQAPFAPHARAPMPGSADLCFLSDDPLTAWQDHFAALSVQVTCGPIQRTGATGPLMSLYINDPDGNLIEVSNQL